MSEIKNKQIIILLSHTGTIFSNLIKTYTREPYSHVSIAFDSELKELYSFGRKRPYNPIICGFVREDLKQGTFGRFINTECSIYTLDVTEKEYYNMKEFVSEFNKNKDLYKYNFIGLFGAALNKPIKRQRAFFCSQFVAAVLYCGGIDPFNKEPELVKPEDFRKLPDLNLIYNGKLKSYCSSLYEHKVMMEQDLISL